MVYFRDIIPSMQTEDLEIPVKQGNTNKTWVHDKKKERTDKRDVFYRKSRKLC
jgi:hypothetical protein